jgi:hypothetical protein
MMTCDKNTAALHIFADERQPELVFNGRVALPLPGLRIPQRHCARTRDVSTEFLYEFDISLVSNSLKSASLTWLAVDFGVQGVES